MPKRFHGEKAYGDEEGNGKQAALCRPFKENIVRILTPRLGFVPEGEGHIEDKIAPPNAQRVPHEESPASTNQIDADDVTFSTEGRS